MKSLIKQSTLFVSIILILLIIASGFGGCVSTTTMPVSATTTTPADAAELIVVNGTQTKTLTMSEIQAMAPVTGSTGLITGSGTINGPYNLQGAALRDILKPVGCITTNDAVKISAKDGYSMTLSYNQVMNGTEFPVYNTTTGKEEPPAGNIFVFIAYEQDGQPISTDMGPLKLSIMAPGQLTDGRWWVKWVQKIEIIPQQTQ
jgi:DMSO/TMAO reductase YedYZ molybdopterin-dependent catalytic subunit